MAFALFIGMIFVSGFICAELNSWKLWLPFAAISGFLTGAFAQFFGVM